jgi:hypothetical protein
MKKTTITKILLAILPICLVFLFIDRCNMSNKYDNSLATIDSLTLQKQELDSTINRQGRVIYTQKTIITHSEQAIAQLTDSIFDLKKKDAKNMQTIAYYKGITNTQIDSVGIPYVDTVAMKKFSDSVTAQCTVVIDYMRDSMITVPRTAEVNNDSFSLKATVKKEELQIDKLSIPDTLQLRFVERKGGLFKGKTIEVQFFHSNPLIQTTSSNSVFYKPQQRSFFRRVVVPVLVGVGTGFILKK